VKTVRSPRLLLGVLALLCLENLVRVGLSVQQAQQLSALPTALSPLYVALTSAAWGAIYLACLLGVARQTAWAWWFTCGSVLLYEVYLWLTRLVFARSNEVFATLGFRAILSAVTLVVVLGLVGLWQLRLTAHTGRAGDL
jgi:hypothetical protein